jgi:uncharacterized membrane protein YGL010W
VPALFYSVIGLLYSVKIPLSYCHHHLNAAIIAIALTMIYYFRLSPKIAFAAFLLSVAALFFWHIINKEGYNVLYPSLFIFVVAWIGQFIGHTIEGRRPSFFKDLQFLLIGPVWIMNLLTIKIKSRKIFILCNDIINGCSS